jgi:hypothetical protein
MGMTKIPRPISQNAKSSETERSRERLRLPNDRAAELIA